MQGANFAIERTSEPTAAPARAQRNVVSMDWGFDGSEAEDEGEEERPEARRETREQAGGEEEGGEGRSRRRRRRGRGRRDRQEAGSERAPRGPEDEASPHADAETDGVEAETADTHEGDEAPVSAREDGSRTEEGENGGRGRRRRRGRRGGRSRQREGTTGPDGSVVAGSPADPGADQPDVDPTFRPHGRWDDLPVRRRDEASLETPDHGVTSQGVTWEIVGAAQEPEPVAEPEAAAEVAAAEPSPPPAPVEAEPEAPTASPPAAEGTPEREPALANGTMAHAESAATPEAPAPEVPEGPPRRGWWQRRFGGN
jgi:ribonuclease E